MKYTGIIILLVLLGSGSFCQKIKPQAGKAYFEYCKYTGNDAVYADKLPKGKFYNPILSGFFPDPSICKKGNDYYLVTSTFSFYPGLPVFHSTDFVNWKQLGYVINRPGQFPNANQPVSHGLFAPAISYNPYNDTFYLANTYVGGGGNFVVTANDPAGPWSDPIWFSEVAGIDPSLFFDDDGKAYMINNGDPEGAPLYQGHKAIWIQEFDVKSNKLFGPRRVIRDGGHNLAEKPIWIEGPHLYKINGYYYLMAAEGGTSINHSEVIFRSKNIFGPYETNPDNPILTQRNLDKNRPNPVTNTGHADLIQDKNGNWYSVFLACRPYSPENMFNIGRETFLLPVKWNDKGWPVILDPGLKVPIVVDLPEGVKAMDQADGYIKRGNFSFTEKFKTPGLPLDWFFLRTPKEKWYSMDSIHGGVWIDARPVNLRELKQPSFIGTRQRHQTMTAETSIYFLPTSPKEIAGLVLFQNEAFHYLLGITKLDGTMQVVLQKAEKTGDSVSKIILGNAKLPQKFNGHIELRAVSENAVFAFYYKTDSSDWNLLNDNVDATYLSTEKAGGFIGTIIGLYASSNE